MVSAFLSHTDFLPLPLFLLLRLSSPSSVLESKVILKISNKLKKENKKQKTVQSAEKPNSWGISLSANPIISARTFSVWVRDALAFHGQYRSAEREAELPWGPSNRTEQPVSETRVCSWV